MAIQLVVYARMGEDGGKMRNLREARRDPQHNQRDIREDQRDIREDRRHDRRDMRHDMGGRGYRGR